MIQLIYTLDLVGTLAFAIFGAYVALRKKFDIFGIFLAAFLTALGGGTIREIILGNIPFYFKDSMYIIMVLIGSVISIVLYNRFQSVKKYVLIIDAIGLSTFAFIGASKAAEANLGIFAVIFLATITAVGGGLVRDIVIREIPQICYKDFYASPAIFLGTLYSILEVQNQKPFIGLMIIFLTFILRIIAVYFNLKLWTPIKENKKNIKNN